MKDNTTSLFRPVVMILGAGLFWLVSNNADTQIVVVSPTYAVSVSTNVIVTSSDSASYRGNAVAAVGFAGGRPVFVADAALLSATGGAQEAATLETTVGSGLSLGESHAAVVGQGTTTA